jgi:hypothetical protein
MPASGTLTAYYTFTAGTKARASQMNANLEAHRGHVIPIDPTATVAPFLVNNTYDLGSSDYYWRTTYSKSFNKGTVSATTTAGTSGFAQSSGQNQISMTTVASHLGGSTITVATTGAPVELSFRGGKFGCDYATATGSTVTQFTVEILKDGASLTTFLLVTDNSGTRFNKGIPSSAIRYVDFPAANTTVVYSLRTYVSNTGDISFTYTLGNFYGRELY